MKRNDKSRYNGCSMNIYGAILPGATSLTRLSVKESKQARQRIKWLDYYNKFQQNTQILISIVFQILTIINYGKRFQHYSLSFNPEPISGSTVGRVIKKYNLFFKSPYRRKKERYAGVNRRKLSKDYPIKAPGDLIESDTKHMPFLGQKRYCFVAIDCVGKAIAVKISSTPSPAQNSLLIEQIKQTFPFSIKSWRNDNGGENLKDFHKSLEKAEISQYFTHPSCPKDKPFVERVIGTIEREFIQQGKLACDVKTQQKLINEWLDEYHNYRPHQALGYLTPNEYYKKKIGKTIKQLSPMY